MSDDTNNEVTEGVEINPDSIQLEESWKKELLPEFKKPYMKGLKKFLQKEYQNKKKIFPEKSEFFNAFTQTPFDKVKIVIIGQDPYHGPNQAHGLCFSVRPGVPVPPSLQNIYKELEHDMGIKPPTHGFLESWAKQGVFLLNATLSVEAHKAGSHQNKGWETFTTAAIDSLNEKKQNLIFILWGSYAQKKGERINTQKHQILKAPHPSPLSAYRGFFGCHHFSKANNFLKQKELEPINWQLP